MGFREEYDRLIEMLATEEKATEIMHAKIEFWTATGKMHGDEPSFEARMSAFFDWYIFDKKVNDRTKLEELLESDYFDGYDDEKQMYHDFQNNVHSIFIVKKVRSDYMKIRDLFTKKDYFISLEDGFTGFYAGAIFEGRILPYQGRLYLSPSICFHPRDSRGIIRYVFKMIRKAGEVDILPLIHRLSYMNLKWETYRNIKVKDIYKFEEYEKRSWWNLLY